jgi:hypothetical protein
MVGGCVCMRIRGRDIRPISLHDSNREVEWFGSNSPSRMSTPTSSTKISEMT